jgi:hypothetical protein
MEALPLDVLCLVLEQLEVSRWMLRLRAVSRVWRRAVDRVAAKTLPLALGQHGGTETLTSLTLPCIDKGESYAAVGCGVFQLSGEYVRLDGVSLTHVATLRRPHVLWSWGEGCALALDFQRRGGTLLQFRGKAEVARTAVAREMMETIVGAAACATAEDGSVRCCCRRQEMGVLSMAVLRLDLQHSVAREEHVAKEDGMSFLHSTHLVGGRHVNAVYESHDGDSFARTDVATGETSLFEMSDRRARLGAAEGDFVAVRSGDKVLYYDFAFSRLVQVEVEPDAVEVVQFRFHAASDLLVAVTGGSFCAVYSRCNGRRLWLLKRPGIQYAAFCGPSLLVFAASGVVKVDWS